MTHTMTIEDAQGRLAEVVAGLAPGDEVVLTRNDTPVATLLATPREANPEPRRFGTMKGSVLYMAPDFDDIPEGFEDYVP
ncbi:MAG: hypothetical protein K2P78_07080 [Gemmataceae bacterium]|nr:hypothetical protein [Gemmataceae bacterium]